MDLIDNSLYESVVRVTIYDSESLSIPDTGAGFTVVAGDNASGVGGGQLGFVAGGALSVLLLALIIFKTIMRIRCRNTNDEPNIRSGKKFGLIVALVGFLVGSLSSFAGSSLGAQAAEPSVDVSIAIDKKADFSGASVVVPVEIRLREDYDYGYDLYAYMATDNNELKSDATEDVINVVSSDGVALSGNTWGIVGGIATAPSVDDSVWGMVGDSKKPTFLSKDLGDAKAGDTITVYLGVSIDASLPTGTYTNKVAYYVYHPAVLDAVKASSSQCDEFFSISMRRELPDGFVANDSNTVSAVESRYPIYSFRDDHALYFYTDAKRITVSPDAVLDFSALNNCLVISGPGVSQVVERYAYLTDISGLSGWDMSRVTNMSNMFRGDIFLERLDPLSGWDTSSATDMSYMFADDTSLGDLDPLSGWDTSSVTNMESMFAGISSTANVSGINDWDIRNVTNFWHMFSGVRSAPEFTKVSGRRDIDGTFIPDSTACFNSSICNKPTPYIP